ncbi:MAG: hypothetical protein DMF89_12645 [Acidobacteria bacterium]|nr:MAG: hypothetical protein DMF89_12645 [Acidobacteriota bacterium]
MFRHPVRAFAASCGALLLALVAAPSLPRAEQGGEPSRRKTYGTHFQTSDRCVACHNGITTRTGEDISIGVDWRTSMMANAGRDPYWMAGVRREMIDHPTASKVIQDECSICHMPMMRYEATLAGGAGDAFAHLPPDARKLGDRLADDGVSCTVCHQITNENFGMRESFVGRFKIDALKTEGERHVYGSFDVDKGHTTIMHSASAFRPVEGKHIRSSELCATCHTLLTKALDAQGRAVGELPEQVPYQEWKHSDYARTKSCQSCHMPVVKEKVPITSVFGELREGFGRHTFVGGNFFMQRMLNRFRNDLAVTTPPRAMEGAALRTIAHLQSEAARVKVQTLEARNGRLEAVVSVENLGGHKLPTAYPSRRAWLHVTVRDSSGRIIFESGALGGTGAIQGNDNDEDGGRFEPHYREITRQDQVQIYETVMAGIDGQLTTGLLTAVRYVKDNRLLPQGFDKATATNDIAVRGEAELDVDFSGGGDRVRYVVTASDTQGPFELNAELWYQPIAYRWAVNLKRYDAAEPRRFVGYYEATAAGSAVILAHASASSTSPRP